MAVRTYSIRQDDTLTASCRARSISATCEGPWIGACATPRRIRSRAASTRSSTRSGGRAITETTKLISGEPLPSFFSYKAPAQSGSKPFNLFNDTKPEGGSEAMK